MRFQGAMIRPCEKGGVKSAKPLDLLIVRARYPQRPLTMNRPKNRASSLFNVSNLLVVVDLLNDFLTHAGVLVRVSLELLAARSRCLT